MELERSQEPDPDLPEAGSRGESLMEQPPEQEGTIPTPSSGERTSQLPEEDGIPAGSQEVIGRDGIPAGIQEAVGRDGIPAGIQEATGRDGIPAGSQEAIGRDGIPAGIQEAVGRDGIPGGIQEAVGRDGIPAGSQEVIGRDGIPAGSQEAIGRDGIPAGSQEAIGRDGTPAGSQDSVAPAGQTAVPCGGAEELPLPRPLGEHPLGDAKEKQPSEAGGAVEGPPVPSPAARAAEPAAEAPQRRSPSRGAEEDFYCVKWIRWKGERTPIITQSQNGPCPLLAIMNILFLQWKVKLPPQKEVITAEELMAHLGDCILATQPREPSEGLQLNFQQNINDTMMVLPKLSTGLDVNVRFTGVSDFEYTPECIVFDLLNVPLYHGWLVDPQTPEVVQAVGKLSYNQLVEKIITCKQANDSSLVSEGLVAEQFLESTASQLTYHGLCELTAAAREGELGVFFRNNHFSTMTKHQGHLYLLVTDQGFLQEESVVWESLHTVDGDSCFCDTDFHLSHSLGKEGGATAAPPEQSQVDQDYMMALSLQQQQGQDPSALSDLELARQLQQEEYQQQQQPQPPLPPPQQQLPMQARGRPAGERRQRQKPDLDCTLL